jgi:uncharacterized protein (DUF433 family)
MALTLHADPLPLRIDGDGTVCVADSRITLDIVIEDYESGMSAETIAQELDGLDVGDVYAILAFYLRHRNEVADYLHRRDGEAAEIMKKLQAAGMTWPDAMKVLSARRENTSHVAPRE